MPEFHSQSGAPGEQPMAGLLQAESAWLASVPSRAPSGPWLWMGPTAPELALTSPVIGLALDSSARLAGAWHCEIDALPLQDECIARIVLQHVLEPLASPLKLLGECVRSLMPGGELVVIGVNPWSLWNWQLRRRTLGSGMHGKARLAGRLTAQLSQLGLGEFFIERYGARWPSTTLNPGLSPPVGGAFRAIYVLRCRKSRASVITLRPVLRAVPNRQAGLLATPSHRSGVGID
jgi:SAM-dependent methyltransferase